MSAVLLGAVGNNFAAGMTGGMAFVLDREDGFLARLNDESVVAARLDSAYWEGVLRALIADHVRETGSPQASELLREWSEARGRFLQVCPREMIDKLEHPLSDRAEAASA